MVPSPPPRNEEDWEEPITTDDVMEHILQVLFEECPTSGPIGDALTHGGWDQPFHFASLEPKELRTRFTDAGEVYMWIPLCARDINKLKVLQSYHDTLLDGHQVVFLPLSVWMDITPEVFR